MRALAITGIETVSMMLSIMSGSLMRETPPCARMSAGTRSSAMTATAPASSAIRACSAETTSMMTPPLSISARPRLTRSVPVSTNSLLVFCTCHATWLRTRITHGAAIHQLVTGGDHPPITAFHRSPCPLPHLTGPLGVFEQLDDRLCQRLRVTHGHQQGILPDDGLEGIEVGADHRTTGGHGLSQDDA